MQKRTRLLKCLTDGDARVVQSAVVALEKIAGFSLGDGRSAEEVEAWSRWIQNQLRYEPIRDS